MDALRSTGLETATLDAVASGRPFLGICVGMQMLFTRSEEDATARGLDVIPGTVRWIPPTGDFKIPQMQWNRLDVVAHDDPMLAGLGDDAWLYFVHSLHGVPEDPSTITATVEYGTTINAAFRRGNVFAAQFHPEKSSRPGLALLANFVRSCERSTEAR
jgi:glutamine amidotransferase